MNKIGEAPSEPVSRDELHCCGVVFGVVNLHRFTRAANAAYLAVEAEVGNAHACDDPRVRALMADPAAHEEPAEGEQLTPSCPSCGAGFVFVRGRATRHG